MADETLLRLVRYNTWANLELLKFCTALPPEQLEWTAAGTYGTLKLTLHHIVRAEHFYLWRLTGEAPPIEVQGRSERLTRDRVVSMNELTERAASNGERMERLVSDGLDELRVLQDESGSAVAAIVAAQYIHHGNDHRAHAGTVLSAKGVETPFAKDDAWDLWGYGLATGEVKFQ